MKNLLFTLLLLLPLAGHAQQDQEEDLLTGAELLDNCQPAAGEQAPTSYCMEFVFGLVRTLVSLQEMAAPEDQIFCIDPDQVPLQDVTTDVTEWLKAHPERLQEPAFLLTSEALSDNYPCASQSKST